MSRSNAVDQIINITSKLSPQTIARHQVALAPVREFIATTDDLIAKGHAQMLLEGRNLDALIRGLADDLANAPTLLAELSTQERIVVAILYNDPEYGLKGRDPFVVEYARYAMTGDQSPEQSHTMVRDLMICIFGDGALGLRLIQASEGWALAVKSQHSGDQSKINAASMSAMHSIMTATTAVDELQDLRISPETGAWFFATGAAAFLLADRPIGVESGKELLAVRGFFTTFASGAAGTEQMVPSFTWKDIGDGPGPKKDLKINTWGELLKQFEGCATTTPKQPAPSMTSV